MEPMLEAIETVLRERHGSVHVEHIAKPTAYSVDDPEFRKHVLANADAFVYAAAFSASTTHYAIHYGAMLEEAGCPGVVLAYDTLKSDAENSVRGACARMRWLPVPYPTHRLSPERLSCLAVQTLELLMQPRCAREQATGIVEPEEVPKYIEAAAGMEQDWYYDRGCTDGLPVVLPSDALVDAMLQGSSRPGHEVVATNIGPEGWTATVENVAINAVMAGCKPEALPVVLASVEAYAGGPAGNRSMFATQARATSSFAFMQVVNGPMATACGMNGGLNALGPGNRANATIGRALRLAVLNLGGGKVGVNLMPVIGNVAAYTFAFAENESATPWPSLAASRGFGPQESVLTFFSGGWSHTGNYIEAGLERLAADASCFEYPSGLTILMSAARARDLAVEGWTKERVEDFVWRESTRPLRDLRETTYWPTLIEPNLRGPEEFRRWPVEYLDKPNGELVQVYPRNAVKVVVVGADVSPMMQAWKMQLGSSVSIDRWR
jgi:hypothetical protein